LLRSAVELRPEKRRRRLQNDVGSAQLSVLTLQPLQLRQLVARGPSPATGITLGLANPVPHRLRCRTQLLGHRRDRFPLRPVLMLMIEHHPHPPLTQLGRVSPMSWHNSILPKERSLPKTRGDSDRSVDTRLFGIDQAPIKSRRTVPTRPAGPHMCQTATASAGQPKRERAPPDTATMTQMPKRSSEASIRSTTRN